MLAYLSCEVKFVFGSNLIGLAESVVVQHFGFLVLEASQKGFPLVASNDVDGLHYFFLDFSLFVSLDDCRLDIIIVRFLSWLQLRGFRFRLIGRIAGGVRHRGSYTIIVKLNEEEGIISSVLAARLLDGASARCKTRNAGRPYCTLLVVCDGLASIDDTRSRNRWFWRFRSILLTEGYQLSRINWSFLFNQL